MVAVHGFQLVLKPILTSLHVIDEGTEAVPLFVKDLDSVSGEGRLLLDSVVNILLVDLRRVLARAFAAVTTMLFFAFLLTYKSDQK